MSKNGTYPTEGYLGGIPTLPLAQVLGAYVQLDEVSLAKQGGRQPQASKLRCDWQNIPLLNLRE